MRETFDFIVIGGGSGGVATARRAAAHGASVVLIEQARLGGTCVNVGCVPKKVMWHAAEMASAFAKSPGYGFAADKPAHDWGALVARREAYIQRLNGIYARNLEKAGVTVVSGEARFLDDSTVAVGERALSAPHILIASGGQPRWPQIPGAALGTDSDGFFALQSCPKTVALVGSGYIAVELAGVLNALGADTTLLLRKNHVVKQFDDMLGAALLDHMRDAGVNIVPNTQVTALEKAGNGVRASYDTQRQPESFDTLIWAIGRAPHIHPLHLDGAGVEVDARDYVAVDAYQNTSVAGIYALGDVTGQMELTPVAIAAGRRLADRVFGGALDRHLNYANVPSVVFTHPPIGSVGLSEDQARRQYGDAAVTVYQTRFTALFYGVLDAKSPSHMKLVCVGDNQQVIGVHIIGEGADEMLQGFAVAVRMGATKADFDDTVAIHPTSAEELVTMT